MVKVADTDRKLFAAYVNDDAYKLTQYDLMAGGQRAQFSWWALLFGSVWFAYRKHWTMALFALALAAIHPGAAIISHMVWGSTANRLYTKKVCSTINKKLNTTLKNAKNTDAIFSTMGGTSKLAAVSFVILQAIVSTLIMQPSSNFDSNSKVASLGSKPSEVTIVQESNTTKGITPKFEVSIAAVVTRSSFGNEFFNAQANEGAALVGVRWKYKNISNEAISAFSTPDIYLIDPNGAKYEADLEATVALASMINVSEKGFSDLNPSITVQAATAFEVSKELAAKDGWKVLVDTDKDFKVDVKL